MVRFLFWSLRHRRWRHVLNAGTIAITVAVIMMFISVMSELLRIRRINASRDFERILVNTRVPQPGDGFPLAVMKTLEAIPGVKVVQPVKNFSGRHPSGASYYVAGETESGVDLGRDFFPVAQDVFDRWKQEKPLGAIVTDATAKELNLKVGQTAQIPTSAGPMEIKVVGFSYNAMFAHRIVIHFDYAQQLTGNKGTSSNFRVITAPADYARVAKEIIERTKNSSMPAQAFSDAQFMNNWIRQVSLVPAILGFLGLFLVLTTTLTLANGTAIGIRERRTEIATLRVLGFRRAAILKLLLGESTLVGLGGGIAAVIITYVVFRSGVQLTPGTQRLLQDVTINRVAVIGGLLTAVAVPLLGTVLSATKAVRVALVEALRDAG